MNPVQPTGEDVRRAREEAGLSQEVFAAMFGVSRNVIEGHEDARTTQVYAHLRPRDEDINRF